MIFHKSGERHNPYNPRNKDGMILQTLAFSNEPNIVEIIEKLIIENPSCQGDLLIALWYHNKEKTLLLLDRFQAVDPTFAKIEFRETFLSSELFKELNRDTILRNKDHFFPIFYFQLIKDSPKFQESFFHRICVTQELMTQKTNEIRNNRSRTREFIKYPRILTMRYFAMISNVFTSAMYDKILDLLWDKNIILNETSIIGLKSREIEKIISYKFSEDVKDLFECIRYVSSNSKEKIITLFNNLPYWVDEFKHVELKAFELDPTLVKNSWKKLLLLDAEVGIPEKLVTYPHIKFILSE
jgi:hypothetical protein